MLQFHRRNRNKPYAWRRAEPRLEDAVVVGKILVRVVPPRYGLHGPSATLQKKRRIHEAVCAADGSRFLPSALCQRELGSMCRGSRLAGPLLPKACEYARSKRPRERLGRFPRWEAAEPFYGRAPIHLQHYLSAGLSSLLAAAAAPEAAAAGERSSAQENHRRRCGNRLDWRIHGQGDVALFEIERGMPCSDSTEAAA